MGIKKTSTRSDSKAATFTPGPWEIWGPCNSDSPIQKPCMVVQSTSADVQVAECDWEHGDAEAEETAIADARLIAQAPTMYALATEIIRGDGTADSQQRAIDMARAILAAVEGK